MSEVVDGVVSEGWLVGFEVVVEEGILKAHLC